MESLQTDQRHVIELASEKGASIWRTILPLKRYDFTLTNPNLETSFALDITLRPKIRPLIVHVVKKMDYHTCSSLCEENFTHMGHNDIRDTFAKIMHDFCYHVKVELTLQLLQCASFIQKTTSTD